ncbi:hypothetical protein J6590_043573 [Homalodisca vitripennis]|nr:hypothetical protein J6590_043573 [Homalodisca vitripennis]
MLRLGLGKKKFDYSLLNYLVFVEFSSSSPSSYVHHLKSYAVADFNSEIWRYVRLKESSRERRTKKLKTKPPAVLTGTEHNTLVSYRVRLKESKCKLQYTYYF